MSLIYKKLFGGIREIDKKQGYMVVIKQLQRGFERVKKERKLILWF